MYYDREGMVRVTKANGEKEAFSEEKLLQSIRRSGLPSQIHGLVVNHIKEKLYEDIPTSEIYSHITEFLGKSAYPYAAARYSLKQAVMSLGPTGYPFEDFIARLLKEQGYKTSLRTILSGKCVSHEVDVIAEKNTLRAMIEAKYHNQPGNKTNVHVALYTKARFDDVLEKNNLNQAWLVTNTKATTDAIAYAVCMGMKVISWDYPEGESLRDLIQTSGLFPITALTTLSEQHKKKLLEKQIIFSKDIVSNPSSLVHLEIPEHTMHKILSEAEFTVGSSPKLPNSSSPHLF